MGLHVRADGAGIQAGTMSSRNAAAVLLTVAFASACGGPAVVPSVKPEPGPRVSELAYPARTATHVHTDVYARLEGTQAVHETEVSYALGEGYPAHLTLSPTGIVYIAWPGCSSMTPTVAGWTSLGQVTGDAATLTLTEGLLTVDLLREGTVTAVLEGEVTGPGCKVDGVLVTTLALRHRLTVRVRRIHGLQLEHPSRYWPGCDTGTMTVVTGAELAAPTAHPVDFEGALFAAANAPQPVALTLRASEGLIATTMSHWRYLGTGRVTIEAATPLPLTGVRAFEVVGRDALTRVDAALYLSRTASKGGVSTLIEEGASYRLFFPDEPNTVSLLTDQVTTTAGPLCGWIPGDWYAAATETPAQCAVRAAEPDALSGGMIGIVGAGECRMSVTIPGTAFAWRAAFSTTR